MFRNELCDNWFICISILYTDFGISLKCAFNMYSMFYKNNKENRIHYCDTKIAKTKEI